MADNVLWAAEELSLSIGRQTLYDNTEFSIAGGERVGLVGRNGSGKSTLFRLITGEELPGGGSITRARELRVAAPLRKTSLRDLPGSGNSSTNLKPFRSIHPNTPPSTIS